MSVAAVAVRPRFWGDLDVWLFSRPGSRAVPRYNAFPAQNSLTQKIRHFLAVNCRLRHRQPCKDNDDTHWLGYGKMLTWMLRQTEVTTLMNEDHRLLAPLASGSQKAQKSRQRNRHLSKLAYRDCWLLTVLSWACWVPLQQLVRFVTIKHSAFAFLLHSSEFLNSHLIRQKIADSEGTHLFEQFQ